MTKKFKKGREYCGEKDLYGMWMRIGGGCEILF